MWAPCLKAVWRACLILALSVATSLALSACGGGSAADAGTSVFDDSDTTSTTDTSYSVAVAVVASGSTVGSVSAASTVQATATVTDASGAAVAGVLVSFSDSVGLLTYDPAAATALTDDSGVASLDITPSATGATVITASTTLSDTTYSGTAALSITTSASATATPAAIHFISVTPASQSIVIQGAGGNGRVETAILKFQVLDGTGAAISGAGVLFSASPASAVTLNVATATTDASGYVSTTVQSGSSATTVVITATSASHTAVSGKSDTLTISTGSIYQAGFGIYADTYNLDGTLVGDDTLLTAFLTDANGNPVADGVAVSFTTDYGAVGSSDAGACTTSNGACSVSFKVAPPLGDGLATVVATANDGSNTLASTLQVHMAATTPGGLAAYAEASAVAQGAAPVTAWSMSSCAGTLDLYLMDATGRSAAAGTVVAVATQTPGDLSSSVDYGGTVQDAVDFTPTLFTLAVDASESELKPCRAAGTVAEAGHVRLSFTTPGSGRIYTQRLTLSYPQ